MEEERMEAIKTWLEPKSIRNIQVFLGFANFYHRFSKGFSKIAAPLTSMPKTTTAISHIAVGLRGAGNEGGGDEVEKSAKANKPILQRPKNPN